MGTTTIRLPAELRARVVEAANRVNKSPHAFIVEAIAEKTEQAERREDFIATANERYAEIVKTGKTVRWSEARAYLEARLAGRKPRRPAAKKLR